MKKSQLTRRTELRRGGPIARKPMKKRGPSKAETARKYGTKEFREWLHNQPCCLCGVVGFTQQAHVGKHGMGKKLGWQNTVPLCGPWVMGGRSFEGCHAQFDQKKLDEFQVARIVAAVEATQEAFAGSWI
jgi:hypothetical protein